MGAAMKKIGGCSEVEDLAKAVGLVVVFDHVHPPTFYRVSLSRGPRQGNGIVLALYMKTTFAFL